MTAPRTVEIQDGDWSSGDPERAAARALADEYAALTSMPAVRIMELINRCWSRYPEGDRRQLAQALLAILAPLDRSGAKATPEIRGLCERVVLQWRERILAQRYAGSKT
jgi:hypothetical protein